MVHHYAYDLKQIKNLESDAKETIALQLKKLQKDNSSISLLSAQAQKLKSTVEQQENEKIELQQKIESALKDKMTFNLKFGD